MPRHLDQSCLNTSFLKPSNIFQAMVQIVQIEIVQIDKVGLGLLAIPSKTKGSKASSRIRATTGTYFTSSDAGNAGIKRRDIMGITLQVPFSWNSKTLGKVHP